VVFFLVMNTPITTPCVVSLLSLALLGSLPLKAQTSGTQGTEPTAAAACQAKCGKGHGKEWLSVLNEKERSQLKAAMKQVKNDPQLVAARQALKDAQTKEAKATAQETLRQTRRDLLLKADPSLGPVLEKVKAARSAKPPVS
jgi:hypothetical protein